MTELAMEWRLGLWKRHLNLYLLQNLLSLDIQALSEFDFGLISLLHSGG
jgi:hypothetical protein